MGPEHSPQTPSCLFIYFSDWTPREQTKEEEEADDRGGGEVLMSDSTENFSSTP